MASMVLIQPTQRLMPLTAKLGLQDSAVGQRRGELPIWDIPGACGASLTMPLSTRPDAYIY
jgi:hypothetical protein